MLLPRPNSQRTHDSLQPYVSTISGDLMSSASLCRQAVHKHICKQNTIYGIERDATPSPGLIKGRTPSTRTAGPESILSSDTCVSQRSSQGRLAAHLGPVCPPGPHLSLPFLSELDLCSHFQTSRPAPQACSKLPPCGSLVVCSNLSHQRKHCFHCSQPTSRTLWTPLQPL